MTERTLEAATIRALKRECPGALVWKIRDAATGGLPDLEVAWRGATTKIEFKMLRKGQTIHDTWEDARQLETLQRYERATGRAFVVAWSPAEHCTSVYRPLALREGRVPLLGPCQDSARVMTRDTYEQLYYIGGWRFQGVGPIPVVTLIQETHR